MSDDAIQRSRTVSGGTFVDVWFGKPLGAVGQRLTFQITIESLAQDGTGVQLDILPEDPSNPSQRNVLDIEPLLLLPSGPHRFGNASSFQAILRAKPGAAGQNCSVKYTFKWDG
jgi:hypothetical protein